MTEQERNNTMLNTLNKGTMEVMMDGVKENSDYFINSVDSMVKSYCQDLDELMEDLKIALTQEDSPATDTIERYYAELTNMVYFKSEQLERFNVYSDLAKSSVKEIYNKSLLEASSEKDEKGKSVRTVSENQAVAELGSQYETAVSQVYDHAYRVFKQKIEAATEMVSTLKTILKRRMNDAYFDFQVMTMKTPKEG